MVNVGLRAYIWQHKSAEQQTAREVSYILALAIKQSRTSFGGAKRSILCSCGA